MRHRWEYQVKRYGPPRLFDVDAVSRRIANGERVRDIADELGVTRQAIYRHFNKATIRDLRKTKK